MNTRRIALVTFLIAFLVPAFGFAAAPQGWHNKLDNALKEALKKGNVPQRVIVQARVGQEENVRGLLRGKGKINAEHPSIKAFTALVNTGDLKDLADNDSVENVSLDAKVTADQDVSATYTVNGGGTSTSGARLRATLGLDDNSITGRYVGVAVVDSGIADKYEFSGRIVGFYDFTQGGRSEYPTDDYGHGTHVAGLIASDGSTSYGVFEGVAPNTRLIGLKVLDGNGAGYTSNVIAAIEFATVNRRALGIDIINLSLGHPIFESAKTDPLVLAVEKAVAAGVVVVCSAGNIGVNPATGLPGYAGITSPGNARSAITVGAADGHATTTRFDDTVADYSSRGPTWYDGYAKPDLVAPGHGLVASTNTRSTLYLARPNDQVTANTGYHFLRLSGSSMASAVTSGVAALAIRSHRYYRPYTRDLTPNAVKAILEFSAIPVNKPDGTKYDALTAGTGEVNGAGAIRLAAAIDTASGLGAPSLLYHVDPLTSIGNSLLPWSQNIIWGDNIVWSDNIIWADNIVWAENIVWGENIIWADNIVWSEEAEWGDNIVWGENIVWSENVVWSDNVVWGDCAVGSNSNGVTLWGIVQRPDLTVWGTLAATSVVPGGVL